MTLTQTKAEAEARRLLLKSLRREFRMARDCRAILVSVAESLPGKADLPHQIAHACLLNYLANGLRVLEWALLSGYPFQAMALAASAHEAALASAHIGKDDRLAEAWLEWTRTRETPWRRGEMLMVVPHDRALYDKIYEVLCAAKHANPRSVQKEQASQNPIAHILSADPEFSPRRPGQARLILWMALKAVFECTLLVLEEIGLLDPGQSHRLNSCGRRWLDFDRGVLDMTWRQDSSR